MFVRQWMARVHATLRRLTGHEDAESSGKRAAALRGGVPALMLACLLVLLACSVCEVAQAGTQTGRRGRRESGEARRERERERKHNRCQRRQSSNAHHYRRKPRTGLVLSLIHI